MPRYLVRVELRDAKGSDYARLNHFMVEATFETSMTGDNGRCYRLPLAEYYLATERDLHAVRGLVEHNIERIGEAHIFIVVEIASATWSLHER